MKPGEVPGTRDPAIAPTQATTNAVVYASIVFAMYSESADVFKFENIRVPLGGFATKVEWSESFASVKAPTEQI
jgi:hypothetical protein